MHSSTHASTTRHTETMQAPLDGTSQRCTARGLRATPRVRQTWGRGWVTQMQPVVTRLACRWYRRLPRETTLDRSVGDHRTCLLCVSTAPHRHQSSCQLLRVGRASGRGVDRRWRSWPSHSSQPCASALSPCRCVAHAQCRQPPLRHPLAPRTHASRPLALPLHRRSCAAMRTHC